MSSARYWRLWTLIFILAVASAGFPRGADAQAVLDPESPTAKEYSIPLERARQDASGRAPGRREAILTREARGETRKTPPFGVGLRRGSSGSPKESGDGEATPQGPPSVGEPNNSAPRGSRQAIRADVGVSAALPTGGIALAVIGSGLLFGLGVRRARRR